MHSCMRWMYRGFHVNALNRDKWQIALAPACIVKAVWEGLWGWWRGMAEMKRLWRDDWVTFCSAFPLINAFAELMGFGRG